MPAGPLATPQSLRELADAIRARLDEGGGYDDVRLEVKEDGVHLHAPRFGRTWRAVLSNSEVILWWEVKGRLLPEGPYPVTQFLREWCKQRGYVHATFGPRADGATWKSEPEKASKADQRALVKMVEARLAERDAALRADLEDIAERVPKQANHVGFLGFVASNRYAFRVYTSPGDRFIGNIVTGASFLRAEVDWADERLIRYHEVVIAAAHGRFLRVWPSVAKLFPSSCEMGEHDGDRFDLVGNRRTARAPRGEAPLPAEPRRPRVARGRRSADR